MSNTLNEYSTHTKSMRSVKPLGCPLKNPGGQFSTYHKPLTDDTKGACIHLSKFHSNSVQPFKTAQLKDMETNKINHNLLQVRSITSPQSQLISQCL